MGGLIREMVRTRPLPGTALAVARQVHLRRCVGAAVPAAEADCLTVRLRRLAELHRMGLLSDAELAAAKAGLLGA